MTESVQIAIIVVIGPTLAGMADQRAEDAGKKSQNADKARKVR